MTFDPHRGYFHDGLPGSANFYATATDADGNTVELMPAVRVERLTRDQLAELVAGRTPAAIVASHVFGAMWTGEQSDKAARDADFGERMAKAGRDFAERIGNHAHPLAQRKPQVELEPGVQRVEMQAGGLALLAESIGLADEVTVEMSDRVARAYWHKVATTSDRPYR